MVFPDKVIQFLTGGFNKNTINLSDFIIENVITLCIGCIFSGALRAPILTCKIPTASAKNIHFYAIFQAKILKTGPQFPKIFASGGFISGQNLGSQNSVKIAIFQYILLLFALYIVYFFLARFARG